MPKAEFHQLFGSIHAADFEDGIEHHLFSPKVILDEPECDTALAVKNVILTRDFMAFDPPRLHPRMQGRNNKMQLIGKQRIKFELRFSFRFERKREINSMSQQRRNKFRRVARFK